MPLLRPPAFARSLRQAPRAWPLRHLALLLMAAGLGATAQAQGMALASQSDAGQSLSELVAKARGYDAPWQAQQAETQAAASRAEQARAGLLPSVGLQAGATTTRVDVSVLPNTLRSPQQNVQLSAQQPLYRPANKIAYDQGQRGADAARAQLDSSEQSLLVRVAQAYFDVLGAQDSLAVVKTQKQAIAQQLEFARRNFEVGTATVTDSREAQARFDLAAAQEIAAENDVRVKRLALDQIVGFAGTRPRALAQPLQLPALAPADAQAWVDTALQSQPQLRQARLALDIAQLETRKAEAGHKPTVDLQAGYVVNRYPNGSVTPQIGSSYRTNAASVGVVMNLPLFAGFAVQNRIKETQALEDKARAQLDDAQRNVEQSTRTAFFGVQSGLAQVKALEAALASSQSALDANKLGYEVGVRINIDVLNAQSQLYQTQRDLALARYQVLLGQLKLRQAAGTLRDEDLRTIDALSLGSTAP